MELKKTIAWIGAATLTTTFFAALMWPDEAPSAKTDAETNLFAFIKPLNNAEVSDSTAQALRISQQHPSAEAVTERAALYAAQQPALREVPDATMKISAVQQTAQKMRSEGASEDEVYRMRAAELSAQAAAQLAGLERDENAWKSRVNAYLAERDKLLGTDGLAQEDALQQLRNARFTSDEQKLLAAYEPAGVPQLKMD